MKKVLDILDIKETNKWVTTGAKRFDTKWKINVSTSPVDGKEIAKVQTATFADYNNVVKISQKAFKVWSKMPAPQRWEIVRQIWEELRKYKHELWTLVSWEMWKIYQEGLGEVQEMIDICDFAVGQSRQLYGFTMHSERPQHRMYDQYHSLGVVWVISAFNFPVAVWAWNAMIAAIAGDVVIWKPSSKTPLTAIATQNIISKVLKNNNLPEWIFNLVVANSSEVWDQFLEDKRVPLISVTWSTAVGKRVAEKVWARLWKVIAELGGNNAIIVTPNADLEILIPAAVFWAVGTAWQRCTSTRRLIIHEDIYEQVKQKIINAYKQVQSKIWDPLNPNTLIWPLIDNKSVETFSSAINEAKKEGGNLLFGWDILTGDEYQSGNFVVPAILEAENHYNIVQEETFAPVLYLIKYSGDLDNALELHNGVAQWLSSSIFTLNMREAERFLSVAWSDCGIANVNIGTSGAEIGGAFGWEKDTGGWRESWSDAWKAYMRRQTNTINYSTDLPLAQGIKFDL